MPSIPKCITCGKNAWFDMVNSSYSKWCSLYCRSLKSEAVYNPKPAVQGQPLCRICGNCAYWDGNNYSAGCCKTHANKAITSGYTTPR